LSWIITPTPAEERLIKAATEGTIADYSDHSSADAVVNDPAQGERWGSERTIRAEIIYALAVGTNPRWHVHAKGVQLAGANIVGGLDFQGAKISCPLVFVNCYVGQPIILVDATAPTISLYGSYVKTVVAFRFVTLGSVLLYRGFAVIEGVELDDAKIGGNLDCEGGSFYNFSGPAISADGLQVQGSVYMRARRLGASSSPFLANNEVRLLGAHIRGDLDCSGGLFEASNGRALSADRLVVDGEVCLRNGFRANGEVRLLGGQFRGNLDCAQSVFFNPGGTALNGDSLSVGQVLLWHGFQARGSVRLVGSRINGDLNCTGGSFCAEKTPDNPHGLALTIDRAEIQELFLRGVAQPSKGSVSVAYARVRLLNDDLESWPTAGRSWLDGFVYDTIAAPASTHARERLDWLNRQPTDRFWPQPYEQLVLVLRRMGHERDARKIAIAKQRASRKRGELGPGAFIWNLILGASVGHGYRSWLAIIWMLLFIAVGTAVFSEAKQLGIIAPAHENTYQPMTSNEFGAPGKEVGQPDFQPLLYSIDVLLPFVDLHQKSSWWLYPRKPRDWAYVGCEFYFLGHLILGWLLTGLLVAALAGIIKKD